MRSGLHVLSPERAQAFLADWTPSRSLHVVVKSIDPAASVGAIAAALGQPAATASVQDVAFALSRRAIADGGLVVVVECPDPAHAPVAALWSTTTALRQLVEVAVLRTRDAVPVALVMTLQPSGGNP